MSMYFVAILFNIVHFRKQRNVFSVGYLAYWLLFSPQHFTDLVI